MAAFSCCSCTIVYPVRNVVNHLHQHDSTFCFEIAPPGSSPDVFSSLAVQAKLIQTEDIIIDAKSGVSGAGRSAKQNLLYTEIAEGINSYGVTKHRHMPEIEQVSKR